MTAWLIPVHFVLLSLQSSLRNLPVWNCHSCHCTDLQSQQTLGMYELVIWFALFHSLQWRCANCEMHYCRRDLGRDVLQSLEQLEKAVLVMLNPSFGYVRPVQIEKLISLSIFWQLWPKNTTYQSVTFDCLGIPIRGGHPVTLEESFHRQSAFPFGSALSTATLWYFFEKGSKMIWEIKEITFLKGMRKCSKTFVGFVLLTVLAVTSRLGDVNFQKRKAGLVLRHELAVALCGSGVSESNETNTNHAYRKIWCCEIEFS